MKYLKLIMLISSLSLLISACGPRDRYITITGYAQGGTYAVKMNMNGKYGMISADPEEIRDSVDAILQNIDNSLSGYNKKSLLSRFNAGEEIVPDSIFTDILSHASRIFDETGGVVDVASGALFDIWGFGFKNGEMPADEEVIAIKESCGMERLRQSLSDSTIARPVLNYNAIAQGYSCDLVAGYLYSLGVKDMLVDIGEIFCDGLNPSGQPWSLGIDKPIDGNNDPGAQIQGIFRAPAGPHGIVTSGNYRKFYVKDGKKYAHSIDPRTGYPVAHNLLSATIVADDALTADAYATYCMVVGLEESRQLLDSRDDLEGCLVYDDGGIFMTWCSDGFVLEEMPNAGQ